MTQWDKPSPKFYWWPYLQSLYSDWGTIIEVWFVGLVPLHRHYLEIMQKSDWLLCFPCCSFPINERGFFWEKTRRKIYNIYFGCTLESFFKGILPTLLSRARDGQTLTLHYECRFRAFLLIQIQKYCRQLPISFSSRNSLISQCQASLRLSLQW